MGEAHIAVIIERLKRKFGAAIATHTPQRAVPRDDPRQDPGPRPVQEADRRPRHVRRRLDRARAEPGRRRRVRRAGRRRVGAQGLLPGRREGHPRGGRRGRPRGLSAVGLPGDAVRRVVPSGRLERAVVQDRGVDGAQGRRPPGEAGAARADHGRRDPRPRASTWARSTATSTAGAAGSSGWTPTATCRSSPPTSRRRSCSTTPRSCGRWPTAAGTFSATLDHYEDVPAHIAEKVIDAHRKETRGGRGSPPGALTSAAGSSATSRPSTAVPTQGTRMQNPTAAWLWWLPPPLFTLVRSQTWRISA